MPFPLGLAEEYLTSSHSLFHSLNEETVGLFFVPFPWRNNISPHSLYKSKSGRTRPRSALFPARKDNAAECVPFSRWQDRTSSFFVRSCNVSVELRRGSVLCAIPSRESRKSTIRNVLCDINRMNRGAPRIFSRGGGRNFFHVYCIVASRVRKINFT